MIAEKKERLAKLEYALSYVEDKDKIKEIVDNNILKGNFAKAKELIIMRLKMEYDLGVISNKDEGILKRLLEEKWREFKNSLKTKPE